MQRHPDRHRQRPHLDTGETPPAERHRPTRRLTGKAILWEDDAGVKLQTIYATNYYSSFVEVGVPGAGDTFTAPSDYIAINERYFIYSRAEIEFSGALVLDVIDLYNLEAIGGCIGLDENNALFFSMYGAKGKMLGQLSVYGPFAPLPEADYELLKVTAFSYSKDYMQRHEAQADAELPPPLINWPSPPENEKGFRPPYRPFQMTKQMTCEEIDAVSAVSTLWVGGFQGPHNENKEMMLPNTELLAGLKFTLRFDSGSRLEYHMIDKFNLLFRDEGEADWHEERYEAFESDEKLFLLAHAVTGRFPMEAMTIALDLREGLVTCVSASLGNRVHPREPIQTFLFGVVEADGIKTPKYKRHGFTTELVGRSYTWTYSKMITSQHIYSSPWSYSWTILLDNGIPGSMWSSPCRYAKIRDGVYVMSWVEERSQGGLCTFLFNTKTMHDCGTCFGISHEQKFEFNTFGAEARFAGKLELGDIYGF